MTSATRQNEVLQPECFALPRLFGPASTPDNRRTIHGTMLNRPRNLGIY